jgi:hypothetical protein
MLQTGWSRYARLARAVVQHSLQTCTEHVYATLIYTPHALATLIRSPAAKYGAALKIMQHSQLCKHSRYCATKGALLDSSTLQLGQLQLALALALLLALPDSCTITQDVCTGWLSDCAAWILLMLSVPVCALTVT